MDEKLLKYFELTKENSLLLKNPYYAQIRISEDSFNSRIASLYGDIVTSFGFFDIHIWDSYTETPILSNSVKVLLRIPILLSTKPNRLTHDSKNEEYILEYMPGDCIVVSTKVPEKASVVVKFFELVMSGKLPDDIPYDEFSAYFEECSRLNKFNMKVNSLFVDVIIAVMCRDPNNPARQFREALNDNPKLSLFSRKLVNMDLIPSITSQFSAISSGNPKYGITTSIGAIRSGEMTPEGDISSVFE